MGASWPIRMLVYGAGDAINGSGALDKNIEAQLSRLRQVATNPYVAAVAQLDAAESAATRQVLDPTGKFAPLQVPEFNTGDPDVLMRFMAWGTWLLPAQRTILVLSGHGMAWEDDLARRVLGETRGMVRSKVKDVSSAGRHHPRRIFGHDMSKQDSLMRALLVDGNSRDFLSNAELGALCDQVATQVIGGKIDVLVFDACLMSSWELLQELGNSVSTVVASVDELSAAGVDLAGPVQAMTEARGELSASQLAGLFPEKFGPRVPFDSCVAVDLSRPEWSQALDHFRAFATQLHEWVRASPDNKRAMREALRSPSIALVHFSSGGLTDVEALARTVATALPGVPAECIQSINAAAAALRACVLGKSLGRDYERALGLSIFAPNSETVFAANRAEYGRLTFPLVTGWLSVLEATYAQEGAPTRGIPPKATPRAGAGQTRGGRPLVGEEAEQTTELLVSLRGIKLEPEVRERLEEAIRAVVLRLLGSADVTGDLHISPLSKFAKSRGIKLSPASASGLVIKVGEQPQVH
jgi:hypothetical protein